MIQLLSIVALSIIVHELGHFIVAKILKLNVLSVQLFMYPVFYIFIKGTLLKIGILPIIGYVNAPGIYKKRERNHLIYFCAGILANCLMLLWANPLVFAVNMYMIIFNILPLRSSDGKNIFNTLRFCK